MEMTYKSWIDDTYSLTRPRSAALKKVDAAFAAYEKAKKVSSGSILNERKALQKSLEEWKKAQSAKGKNWKNSVRNTKRKAVERLDAELGHVIVGAGGMNSRGVVMDTEELRAAKELSKAIKQNTRMMFVGQKLTVKPNKVISDLNQVRSTMSTFKTKANNIKKAASGTPSPMVKQQVETLLKDLFGEASAAEVQLALGPIYADFLTNVTPFIGAISSGGKAIKKWGSAAKGLYSKSKMSSAATSFAPGDPSAAFAAILQIQQREINTNTATASIHTVSAGAKTAFTALDFGTLSGTLVGAAETLALLVQKIYLFAHDWNETKAVNELLTNDTLDLNLFKTCPLLGCYLIANSDTSSVINMAVGDYGKTGWKFDVEAMLIKARPVFDKASSVINDSRFEFIGMRGMKGSAINRNKSTMGIPTGKIAGLLHDAKNKVDQIRS